MIEVNSLTKSYGKNIILNNVSFEIPTNEFSFIMGQNGNGKTTFFKCLLNLEKYIGEILFDNKSFNDILGQIYAIYDDSPLYSHLTGYQNIHLLTQDKNSYNRLSNGTKNLLSESVLKRKVKGYSYGQKKKLSIMIAILLEPKYLVIDEISNGLDYETMTWLKGELKELSKKTTIIATGHQFDFYNDIIDNLFIVSDKNIVQVGEKDKSEGLLNVYEKLITKSSK